MQAIINSTSEIKPFINTVVGYVKINKSWINHNDSYECAAWWEDSQIQEGVYPLILKENSFSAKELYLVASLNAIVVDDYFPALWGGLPVSRQPYKPKNIGQPRNVFHRFEIVDSIEKTAYSHSDIDVCVNPLTWQAFINAARSNLDYYNQLLDNYRQDYISNGDGNYNTNLSMISHCSENINNLARSIIKMKDKLKSTEEATQYMIDLHIKNISWASQAA